MQFSIKEWRKFYDKTHQLSKMLHDCTATYDDKGTRIPPKNEISKEARLALISQIELLMQRCSRYLDRCGMRMPPPVWHYNPEDKTTWASHKTFNYEHLVNLK